jgi:hypothetical protein
MAEKVAPATDGARAGKGDRGGATTTATTFRSVGELAQLCGHYCWVERRIFEVTGSRASLPGPGDPETGDPETGDPETGDPEIRVVLSQMSARHGFLAAQWRERLPVRAGVDPEALIVPPPGPAGEVLGLIESEPRLVLVLEGLATQFLPWLLDRYDRHLAQASPVSEAPVRAVLEWAALSTGRELRVAGLLLQGLGSAGEEARSEGNSGARVQRLLREAADTFPGARAS